MTPRAPVLGGFLTATLAATPAAHGFADAFNRRKGESGVLFVRAEHEWRKLR